MKRILASLLCVCAVGIAGVVTLEAQATADYLSQVPFLQRVLTGRNFSQTNALAFVNFVSTSIPVPAGMTVLLSARFAAESNCSEAAPAAVNNWCSVRILIGGLEAEPVVGNDFAFDSTNGGADVNAWESHSMDRHRCYRNSTTATQQVPVVVQWGVANADPTPPVFRIDDWSLVIQESQNCTSVPPTAAAGSDE